MAAIGCAAARAAVRRPLGGISGTIIDAETGEPVAGALVELRGAQGEPAPPAVSNGKGEFELVPLVDGKYAFTVEHAGYASASATQIGVEKGYYTTLAVKLTRGPDFGKTAPEATSSPIVAPVFVSGPAVKYPDLWPQLEGKMRVRCVITVEGVVKECLADQDIPEMAPVIRQLEQRRYRPALSDGVPIQVWYVFGLTLRPY